MSNPDTLHSHIINRTTNKKKVSMAATPLESEYYIPDVSPVQDWTPSDTEVNGFSKHDINLIVGAWLASGVLIRRDTHMYCLLVPTGEHKHAQGTIPKELRKELNFT